MSDDDARNDPFGFNLLLFSVGGVSFGIDAEQIEATLACSDVAADELTWFHRVMEYGAEPVAYREPVVLAIRTGENDPCRVVIDRMEEVVGITIADITPFPPLVEPLALAKGMWGIVAKEGRMILLLDFLLLLKNNNRSGRLAVPVPQGDAP